MKKSITYALFFLLCIVRLSAQSNTGAVGGEATGSGGTSSFTAGEVFYTFKSAASGSSTDGVQQSYLVIPTGVISGNATVCAGLSAQLSIALTGQGPWSGTLSDGTHFSGSANQLLVSVTPTVTTTYTIATLSDVVATATASDLSGNAIITVDSLVITIPPTNPTICKAIGASTSISVAVSGATPTYQWYVQTPTGALWATLTNNANYVGVTGPTLTITRSTTAVPATGTKYRVAVSNACVPNGLYSDNVALLEQTVISKAATISAKSATNGTLSPALTTCQGNSVNLALAAGSIGNIQWQSATDGINFTNIGTPYAQTSLSAVNPLITLSSGDLTQDTWFRVVASNGVCSSVNGAVLKITVSSPAVAGIISGGEVTVCAPIATGLETNGNALTTAITNSTRLSLSGNTQGATIVWQKSVNFNTATPTWSAAGSVASSFIATNLAVDTWYRALVTNGACVAFSEPVKMTVSKAAKAGIITSAASICTGGAITFTSAPYIGTSIQWEVSTTSTTTGFEPVEGATESSFTMTNIAYAPLSKFYVRSVVISGDCTLARSAVKTIVVNPLSVAGRIKGGGILCSNGGSTVSVSGNTGTIQWQYSTDGITYFDAPFWKTVSGVPTYFNPNGTTEFSIPTTTTGVGAAYVFNNFNTSGTVYFKARIKSGACSETYTSSVQFINGLLAVAGTISTAEATICASTGTTLILTGAVGAIQWQKAAISAITGLPGIFANINGQTGTTLSTGSVTATTAYQAVVTIGGCSTITASYVSVVVVPKPITKTITSNLTSTAGAATTPLCTATPQKVLTIGAGSTGAIQWQTSTTSATTGFTDIDDANGISYTVANPAIGANYYRAKFTNSCGLSLYNTAVLLYYKNCSVVEKMAEAKVVPAVAVVPFDVVAYPNPFSNNFNLEVITTSAANVQVNVYDVIGKLVEVRNVPALEVGNQELGNNYPSGVYNITISQGSEMKTLRVIKKY